MHGGQNLITIFKSCLLIYSRECSLMNVYFILLYIVVIYFSITGDFFIVSINALAILYIKQSCK